MYLQYAEMFTTVIFNLTFEHHNSPLLLTYKVSASETTNSVRMR